MNKFAVCPSCGAIGAAGMPCEYCGTTILANEDTITYGERIVSERTINPVAFAQKVSVFKKVGEYIFNCAVVDMGGLYGMINLNGDLLFPLEYGYIKMYPCGIAFLRKGTDYFVFDMSIWKRLDVQLPNFELVYKYVYKSDTVPVKVEKKSVGDFFAVTIEWPEEIERWFLGERRLERNDNHRLSCVFDQNGHAQAPRVIAFVDSFRAFENGFYSYKHLWDVRTQKTYSINGPYDSFCSFFCRESSIHLGKRDWAGVRTVYFTVPVNTEVEDIQAEIDRACKEWVAKFASAPRGACYIATAVYGSYDCPEVWTLRRFRDNTLDKTWYGRMFIKCYYAVSPVLVELFGNTSWFRRMWKAPLDRIVMKLQSKGVQDTPYDDLY